MVRRLTVATASISASWSPGSASVERSMPSPWASLAITIAASAPRAAATAAAIPDADGGCHAKWTCAPNRLALLVYSIRIDTGLPARRNARPVGRVERADDELRALAVARATSRPSTNSFASPACSSERRYRPVSGGVSVPVQRADHTARGPPASR